MPETRHFILGTAGHIDHGKSSLVRALTGIDPDRLPEEKLRGVTIELGFAHLTIESPEATYELGIVDVPGHADFVNNMVAGVGGMDVALLVVAADDGWMPQTEEHLHILSYLGIERVVIALTKADLVEDIDFACEFVRECLRATFLEDAPLVPVSSLTGDGLDELRSAITRTLGNAPPPVDFGRPLLPVDRAFIVKGIGTVVTGTLSGGQLEVGDNLRLHPGGDTARVRTIQNHSTSIDSAVPGMRTALSIPDLSVATRQRAGVSRGTLLTATDSGEPSDTLNVFLRRLSREVPGQPATRKALPGGRRVRVHNGAGSVGARIYYLDGKSLAPGETRIAQLRLDEPRFALVGDRVVIRDWSGQGTLGGGVVLETSAARRGFRSEAQEAFLRQRADAPDALPVLLGSIIRRDRVVSRPVLHQPLRASAGDIDKTVAGLIAAGDCVGLGDQVADAAWWAAAVEDGAAQVADFHKRQPDLPGLPLQDFRNRLPALIAADPLFQHLLASLDSAGIAQSATALARKDFHPSLPEGIDQPAAEIEDALGQDPLNPPGRAELTTSDAHRRALSFLTRSKRVIALGDKAVILASALADAERQVLDHLEQHGQATASELRQVLNTSRRILMPLLEGMDAKGLTRRHGDHRTKV